MRSRLESLVEKNDALVIFPNSAGSFEPIETGANGSAYPAHAYRRGRPRRRLVVKVFHPPSKTRLDALFKSTASEEYKQRIEGYKTWFEKLPDLQEKFPRLIFNNSQLIPTRQIFKADSQHDPAKQLGEINLTSIETTHEFAIASEGYRTKGSKELTEIPLTRSEGLNVELEDLDEASHFVLEQAKEGVLIHCDAIGFVKSGAAHRVVIRDADSMAISIAKHIDEHIFAFNVLNALRHINQLKKQALTDKDYDTRITAQNAELGKIFNPNVLLIARSHVAALHRDEKRPKKI